MGNPLGVYETNYNVKKVQNLSLGKVWPSSDLLFLEWSYCIKIQNIKRYNSYVYAHAYTSYLQSNVRIFMKIYMAINKHLINLSLNFQKDPIIHFGNISILVEVGDGVD